MTRAIICGGRDYSDRAALFAALDYMHDLQPFTEVIHGAASGADTLAGAWAKANKVRVTAVPADWKAFGNAAGMWRNREMADMRPDLVVAFPGGHGTAGMVLLAEARGIRVVKPCG